MSIQRARLDCLSVLALVWVAACDRNGTPTLVPRTPHASAKASDPAEERSEAVTVDTLSETSSDVPVGRAVPHANGERDLASPPPRTSGTKEQSASVRIEPSGLREESATAATFARDGGGPLPSSATLTEHSEAMPREQAALEGPGAGGAVLGSLRRRTGVQGASLRQLETLPGAVVIKESSNGTSAETPAVSANPKKTLRTSILLEESAGSRE